MAYGINGGVLPLPGNSRVERNFSDPPSPSGVDSTAIVPYGPTGSADDERPPQDWPTSPTPNPSPFKIGGQ